MNVDRREALALFGFGVAGPAAAQRAAKSGVVAFDHGVASGDPLADRVILWTRITPESPGEVPYRWRMTPIDRRPGGARSGAGVTGPARDYTVKVDVTRLDAGRAYTYEFESGGVTSPMGRTATLPKGPTEDVVLAVCTCSLHPNGYFNAYGAIAALPPCRAWMRCCTSATTSMNTAARSATEWIPPSRRRASTSPRRTASAWKTTGFATRSTSVTPSCRRPTPGRPGSASDAVADLMAVSTIIETDYTTSLLKSFRVTPGSNGVSGLKVV